MKLFSFCEDSAANNKQRTMESTIIRTGLAAIKLANDNLGLGYKLYVDKWYIIELLFY